MQTLTNTQELNPRDLLVDVNVREDLNLDKDFVGSIKDHGVLVPIVAVQVAEGIRVRFGHRRTHAAIEAGLDTVPVMVVDPQSDDPDSDAAQIERLLTQHAENTHRAGLSAADEIGVATQLSAFGLTANQIARKTRTKKATVEQAIAAGGSELATKASSRYDLTLEQAATLAEFQDDTDTVKALVAAAKSGQFEHVAQQARDDRTRAEAYATALEALAAEGVTVVDQPDYDDKKVLHLRQINHDGKSLDAKGHAKCPGRAVYLSAGRNWQTGEYVVETHEVCTDYKTHGHTDAWSSSGSNSTRTPAAQMSDKERETAKAERRLVIDNNKAWEAAREVRTAWLRTWLTRKTAPKSAGRVIAAALAEDAVHLNSIDANHLATDLLGINDESQYGRSTGLAKAVEQAAEGRATMLALAQVLAAYEAAVHKGTWREKGAHAWHGRYLRFLAEQGYTLSDVETYAASDKTA